MSTATKTREKPVLFSAPMVRALLDGRKSQTRRLIKPQPAGADLDVCERAYDWLCSVDGTWHGLMAGDHGYEATSLRCPFGEPGSRLWVREAAYVAPPNFCDKADCNAVDGDGRPRVVGYAADMDGESVRCATDYGVKKTPSIHMPRWASRVTLEVTGVRVERLQAITEEDAKAEGFESFIGPNNSRGCYWVGPGYWDGSSQHSVHGGKTYHAALQAGGNCACNVGQAEKLTPARCAFRHIWDHINGAGLWDANPFVWCIEFKRVSP